MKDNIPEKNTPTLEPFAGVEFLESIPSAIPLPKFATKFLVKFLLTLQDALGLKLGFQIPDYFLSYPAELWDGLFTIQKLRNIGIANYFERIFKKYEDGLNPFSFHIGLKDIIVSGGSGTGYNFFSQKKALWAAIGEAVERYSLFSYLPEKGEYMDASFSSIKSEALNIFSIAGLSPKQREAGDSHFFMKFDENSKFRWVKSYSLTRGKKIFIPLQLVSFAYKAISKKEEPMIVNLVSTGAATHTTIEQALLNGLLEVIERDAFMITWVRKLIPASIDPKSIPPESEAGKIIEMLMQSNLESHLLYLPSDIPVHIVLCIIIDRSGLGPAVALGASCKFDILNASATALSEAYVTHSFVKTKMDILKGENGLSIPDRNTLDRDGRLLWWSVPERIGDLTFLLQGETKKTHEFANDANFAEPSQATDFLVEFMKKKNLEVVYTEILKKSLQNQLGLKTVMVTVPGMQPLHLYENLPHFYGKRMNDLPEELGLKASREPNLLPHPFP